VTARWRKKLEGIDQVGPRDDVYERAKAGPTRPEAQSPMQRTSTRVATAIAAFVVFALAISLFVVPTLRLHDDSSALSAGGQLLPLWPARTVEQVQALQDEADAGQAGWALDPQQVATRFGQTVLGWLDAWAGPLPSSGGCNVASGPYPSGSYAARAFAGLCPADYVPTAYPPPETCEPSMLLCAGPSSRPGWTSPSSRQFLTFQLLPCDPTTSCSLASINETIELYQPLVAGEGKIWSVLAANSSFIDLAVSPGQTVSNGSSVSTGLRIPLSQQFGFGVHVGASDSCNQDVATDVFHSPGSANDAVASAGSELGVNLGSREGIACAQEEPGYVFVATSETSIVSDGVAIDPLQGTGGPGLHLTAFAAVPIAFEWPDGTASSAAPTPTTTISWTTYTDPLGWTIDVPVGWLKSPVAFTDGSRIEGAAFAPEGTPRALEGLFEPTGTGMAVSITTDPNRHPLPQDDSFPLTCDLGAGGQDFQGDAVVFHFSLSIGAGQVTAGQLVTACHMLESIRFEPSQPGEQRDGWTALNPTDKDPLAWRIAVISWQSCNSRGCYVLTFGEPVGQYLLGPVKPCGEGENMTADAPHATDYVIVLDCPDGSTQRWTRTGSPAPTNSTGYDAQLEKHPVVKAWDGSLLANVDETIG
jgi:hypothetical protein